MTRALPRLLAAAALATLAACAPRPAVKPDEAPAPAPGAEAPVSYANYTEHPAYPAFRDRLVAQGFSVRELDALFEQLNRDQRVLDAITRPAEAKPWHEYRPIFVTPERVSGGVEFWRQYGEWVQRASSQYGVDPEMIVALIGVETRYGAIMGKFPVVATLATLGFDFPPRAAFFAGELEQFLILAREQQWDPLQPVGSYAGAMGAGQFIPSSHRRYAVDFDGDGKIDLWNSMPDAIGSVANYLKTFGWQRGDVIAAPALLKPGAEEPARASTLELSTADALRRAFIFTDGLAPEAPALYVALDQADGDKSYWIGAKNFWVITRYNRSPLYAMAAYELSQEIVRARNNRPLADAPAAQR